MSEGAVLPAPLSREGDTALSSHGAEIVGTQTALAKAFAGGKMTLCCADDRQRNLEGVAITARPLAEKLNSHPAAPQKR